MLCMPCSIPCCETQVVVSFTSALTTDVRMQYVSSITSSGLSVHQQIHISLFQLCLHFLYVPPIPQLDTERSATRELRQRLEVTQRAAVEKTQEEGRSKAEQVKQRNYQTAKATEQVCWEEEAYKGELWCFHAATVHTLVRVNCELNYVAKWEAVVTFLLVGDTWNSYTCTYKQTS